MTVLVFGQTGQVAAELQRQAHVTALSRSEADLSKPMECAEKIRQTGATAVINAAAYTAVDKAEEEEALATVINADAPTAMARVAAEMAVPFLHISTDYVFDGTGENDWSPDDPTNPLGAYGRSKLAGEIGVRNAGGNSAILRTSWVFSAHGNNFVKTMLRLGRERNVLNVVSDQIGGPTPAASIASALLYMADRMIGGQPGGVFHYSGAPNTGWAGFARDIFFQAGLDVRVNDIASAEYPTPAKRPANSRLDCHKLQAEYGIVQPDWRRGLADVLQDLDAL